MIKFFVLCFFVVWVMVYIRCLVVGVLVGMMGLMVKVGGYVLKWEILVILGFG